MTRHKSIADIMTFFAFQHLPSHLQETSRLFYEAATALLEQIDDDPELTVALRKLLESKDAAVRARLRSPR